jgi:hypothetical protein
MDDIDISREACEDHANYCRGFGPSTTPDLILALRAALDRDKASGWKAIDRAVALTFANDVLQAKLDAAEADKAAAVEVERERCAAIAGGYDGNGMNVGTDCPLGDAYQTRRDIAAAIRKALPEAKP